MQVITEGFKEMPHGLEGINIEVGSHLFPQQAFATPFCPRRLEPWTTQLLDLIHQKRQHHQGGKHHGEMLVAVAEIVFKMIALIFKGIKSLIFYFPSCSCCTHYFINTSLPQR